ncbi:hypothetical protein J3R30DRAFT_2734333 [Lentinula aciculospora]|uniref:Uncharacterized protein n=1 Tax=Lentinula aciculospora TaxID=153920 RepID=A0A9W9DNT4_9AGAR|nr:hypothetical protein J3R30DRAFT_2734333 [Lentinula aciculospora]
MSLTGILCCFRPRNDTQQEDTVDERTHLIPTTTEDQPAMTPNLVFIDPIQFRERLGTIVRAKEGRMVNVTPNYRSREHSLNRNSGFHRNRASSRMSSTISSARTTRSTSTPDSISVQDDSDSIVSVGGQGISRIKRIPSTELGREESEGVEESNRPTVIVSAPIIPIRQRPTIPVFDDPSVKLSVSWGD